MQACQRTCRRILTPPESASIDRPEAQLGCRNMCSFRSQAESRLRRCYCFLERSHLALVGFHCETVLCQSDTLPLSYHHQLFQIISITAPLRTAATHIFWSKFRSGYSWEDFPGEGNGNLLQYPYLENSMDRGASCCLQSMGSQRVRHD